MSHYDRVQADILATCGLTADLEAVTAARRGKVDYEDYADRVEAIIASRNARGNARGRRPRSLPLLDAETRVKHVPYAATLSELGEADRPQYCDEHIAINNVLRVWAKWLVLMPGPLFELIVTRRNLVLSMPNVELGEVEKYRKLLWQTASKKTNIAGQRKRPYEPRPAARQSTPVAELSSSSARLSVATPVVLRPAAPRPAILRPVAPTPAFSPESAKLMRQRRQKSPVQTTLTPIGEAPIVIRST